MIKLKGGAGGMCPPASVSLAKNLPSAQKLENSIVETATKNGFEEVKIGTEATSFYDLHLVDYLTASPKLKPFHTKVFRFNPKVVKGVKKLYVDSDKTDPKDAIAVADRLRFGKLPHPYEENQPYASLRRLTRYRFHLIKTIAREKNIFLTHLYLKYSSFGDVKAFSNTFGSTSLSIILDFYSVDELVNTPLEELVQLLIKQSHNWFQEPSKVAELVIKMARESYRIRPALANSVNLILATIIHTVNSLNNALKEVDNAIEKEFNVFPNTLISVKGIWKVYAAGIFSEIGDITNFANHAKLAKMAGLTWRQTKSADFQAEDTKLTRTGNQYLRYYLIQAANSLRIHNEEYKAFYQTKYCEVNKHQHKRALALTARKLVRLVFALLHKDQLYHASVERKI